MDTHLYIQGKKEFTVLEEHIFSGTREDLEPYDFVRETDGDVNIVHYKVRTKVT